MLLNVSAISSGIVEWLEKNSQQCFYQEHFGIACPGCGFQRALIALLKGNLWESMLLFPALIPLIIMGMVLVTHLIFKFKHGALLLKVLFFLNVLLMIGNYMVKLID